MVKKMIEAQEKQMAGQPAQPQMAAQPQMVVQPQMVQPQPVMK
jgi:hypothetical protein